MQDKQNKQNNLDRVLTFSFAPGVSSPRAGLCEVLRRPGWTAAQSGPVDVCSTAVQMPRVSPNSSNIIKYSKIFKKRIPKTTVDRNTNLSEKLDTSSSCVGLVTKSSWRANEKPVELVPAVQKTGHNFAEALWPSQGFLWDFYDRCSI